jgi:putative peptidoglycan lipid II flippase
MFLTIPAALGLAMLAEPVTALLLQRGEFTAFDTELTAGALLFYCFGIVAQAGIEIHSRGFYALGDTRTPVLFAVTAMFWNLALSWLLWDVWEEEGLALAVSAASWVEWVLLYAVYIYRLRANPRPELLAIARFAFCAGVMTLFLALGFAWIDPETWLEHAAVAVCGAAAGAAVYAGMAAWLRIEELDEAWAQVRNRVRQQPRSTENGHSLST